MTTAVPTTAVPSRSLELADLADLMHLLPPTALALVRELGAEPALALIQHWPGVQIVVPMPLHTYQGSRASWRHSAVRRWERIEAVVGKQAMPALVKNWGGKPLDVPICHLVLNEKRDRWIRQRFDALTSPAKKPGKKPTSAAHAIRDISLELSEAGWPMTTREITRTLSRANITTAQKSNSAQLDLFAAAAAAVCAE